MNNKSNKEILIQLNDGKNLMIDVLAPTMMRLRFNRSGCYKASLQEKYGLVKSHWNKIRNSVQDKNGYITVKTDIISIQVDKACGEACFFTNGECLTRVMLLCEKLNGMGAAFDITEKEMFYGLGYRDADFIELRGHKYRNHVSYGECYGPAPFLLSSKKWGVFYNTPQDSYFDIACTDSKKINVWSEDQELDIYLMAGDYRTLINNYTNITGKPYLMPIWAYGLMFICNEKETQFDVLNDARKFRDEDIPCDMIGLEPGWMSKYYDLHVNKDWNREKFYMPWWSEDRRKYREVTFIGALARKGFKTSLWMCCDYDVYEEEERRLKVSEQADAAKGENIEEVKPFGFGSLDFDTRAHSPIYMDKVTVRGEGWFEHMKKFIDCGVCAFKQDPAFIVNDHPDRLYANGLSDKICHNINTTVLAKQVHIGYRSYTGMRPMHYLGTGYTGIQHWAPVWTCDCGGRERALLGMLQYGFTGQMNVTCDMDIHSLEGIHFGFLQPWCLINSWASIEHPWWLDTDMYQTFRYYAKLHYSFIPYIYSTAYEGTVTGFPIMRAMPLVYPEDIEAARLNRQYMLGEWLLVTAFTCEVYLPAGRWIDFWTGKVYEGPLKMNHTIPYNRGGCLFVKAGAIIPCWKEADYSSVNNMQEIILHVYPYMESSFTLYEDDGESFSYEKGEFCSTLIKSIAGPSSVKIVIGGRRGEFAGKTERKSFHVVIHDERAEDITINGNCIEKGDYSVHYIEEDRIQEIILSGRNWQDETIIGYRRA